MKILVTPRSFGKTDPSLFQRLRDAGLEIVRNETGAVLDEESMCRLIAPCAGVILGVDPLGKKVLDNAPLLKAVSRYGVGLDNVDLQECAKRGITVSRTLGAIENAVADYAFSLILGVARRTCLIDRRCRANDWKKITSLDVFGKTLGVIGLGAVGKCVARRAKGFEMRILAHDIAWDAEFASKYDVIPRNVDDICREADIITLHCSLNEQTRHLIDARRIELMKKTAILINTARGGIVDDDALLEALCDNRIYGAGLDVFEREPPANRAWLELDNVILGSHCSSSTKDAVERMGNMALENLFRDLHISQ